jgi:hypothetical protein
MNTALDSTAAKILHYALARSRLGLPSGTTLLHINEQDTVVLTGIGGRPDATLVPRLPCL